MQALKKVSLLDHGKYRIERVLGQGGFGITYLVWDLGLEQYRAIKEFFPKDFCNREDTTSNITITSADKVDLVEKLKRKFLKEAINISRLGGHNGIIPIIATFEENSTAYYVMEYIAGENLSQMVKRSGALSVDRALKYIIEVGKTLEYVHKHRINHLDIKPANIMVRKSDDHPLLIDFGLSKRYDSYGNQTSTTPIGISPGFTPAEQYNVGGVSEFSPQSDVYSLAATLYYLLTGVVPPDASILLNEKLIFPTEVPKYLQTVITRAMNPIILERPETITKFLGQIIDKGEKTELSTVKGRDNTTKGWKSTESDDESTHLTVTGTSTDTGAQGRAGGKKSINNSGGKITLFVILGIAVIGFLAFLLPTGETINSDNNELTTESEVPAQNAETLEEQQEEENEMPFQKPSTAEYTLNDVDAYLNGNNLIISCSYYIKGGRDNDYSIGTSGQIGALARDINSNAYFAPLNSIDNEIETEIPDVMVRLNPQYRNSEDDFGGGNIRVEIPFENLNNPGFTMETIMYWIHIYKGDHMVYNKDFTKDI